MADLTITPMFDDEIGANVALSHTVGWPDTESDWTVIHQGAFVVGARREGRLVGQGALGLYGRAGTIAKMIVDPDCQARGIGSQILTVLLSEVERRGIEILGLVPTPLGDVIGLAGVATANVFDGPTEASDSTEPLQRAEALVRYDERTLGCSRKGMLRARFREAVATASSLGPDGALSGYAMATAQGDHFVVGPVVAETEEQARALIRSLLRSVRGPVRIDVPGEQAKIREWLTALGLREHKSRPEMARGSDHLPWQVPERFALAAQAWG